MNPYPTETVMEPTVLDTDDTVDNIVIPLLHADAYLSLIVTLPLTQLISELTVLNRIPLYPSYVPLYDDIMRSPPKPVVPVSPLTNTAPAVLDPALDAKNRSPPLPPVNITALTVTVPHTPLSLDPTDTVMEPPVIDTDETDIVEPTTDAKGRSPLLPPDEYKSVKEAYPQGAGEKLHPNPPSQGKTTAPTPPQKTQGGSYAQI